MSKLKEFLMEAEEFAESHGKNFRDYYDESQEMPDESEIEEEDYNLRKARRICEKAGYTVSKEEDDMFLF